MPAISMTKREQNIRVFCSLILVINRLKVDSKGFLLKRAEKGQNRSFYILKTSVISRHFLFYTQTYESLIAHYMGQDYTEVNFITIKIRDE